jgi:hypothetical protein
MLMQEDNQQDQPGVVITPGAQITPQAAPEVAELPPIPQEVAVNLSPAPAPSQATPAFAPAQAAPISPVPPQAPIVQPVESAVPHPQQQPASGGENFYTPAPAQDQRAEAPYGSTDGVSWTASEYAANPKNVGWFMLLGLATIVLGAATYLITHDVISTIAICIFGIIVGVFAARKPHVLDYRVDSRGIQIGQKYYPYNTFKAMSYVSLLPLKRFMAPIAIHYSPDDEENILNTLADYLPYEDHKPDMVDNLSRRVRF